MKTYESYLIYYLDMIMHTYSAILYFIYINKSKRVYEWGIQFV